MNDFETILPGDRQKGQNERFNQKYDELIQHLEDNGRVKFIFLALASENIELCDNIKSFNKTYGSNIEIQLIDIKKIRRDFIEFKYKQIKTDSPLEYQYNPEEDQIDLEIERFGDKAGRDFLEFEQTYIFLVKPKTVFELFDRYKFSLFFKNVRNPLHNSNYNKDIVETLIKRPSAFWYFNNGITAITRLVPSSIGIKAKKLKLTGLQIINGAQTVYSIYLAYKEASPTQRKVMEEARITFRLIKSSDEQRNLEITRFTNTQNPMYDKDFVANDEIQKRLQEESFATQFWYEKRRGEFRTENWPGGVRIVSNEIFVK